MPYLSDTDYRDTYQMLGEPIREDAGPEPSFGEVFAASFGRAADEDLSISKSLNTEMYQKRREQIREMADAGEIDISKYQDRRGRIAYSRIAEQFDDVPNDDVLRQERLDLLNSRREYSDSVLERGSGLAQFLGMANAFMLDPFNIATMPVATAGTAVKGMGVLARAMMVARNEAALGAAAEIGIQSLVYEHKHDIGAPYEFKDAMANIAMGAAGAAAFGGLTGGLAGYFAKVRQKAMPHVMGDLNAEEALATLKRLKTDLAANPGRISADAIQAEFIAKAKQDIAAKTSRSLSAPEREALTAELDVATDPKRIAEIESRLESGVWGKRAANDLAKLDEGIIPNSQREAFESFAHEKLVESDTQYLEGMDKTTRDINTATIEPSDFEPLDTEGVIPSATQNASQRAVLDDMAPHYDEAIAKYETIENPKIVVDGKAVDAGETMGKLANEIEGLESIKVCAIA